MSIKKLYCFYYLQDGDDEIPINYYIQNDQVYMSQRAVDGYERVLSFWLSEYKTEYTDWNIANILKYGCYINDKGDPTTYLEMYPPKYF